MGDRVLLLGGTREAVALAANLTDEGHAVTTSLAGRTREPKPVAGELRIGGFGGAEGLAAYLREHAIDRLIDATHPFAQNISRNAASAAGKVGVRFERVERAPWQEVDGDDWHRVADIRSAVDALRGGERVLLALGSQYIAPFAAREDVSFVVRMVDAPDAPLTLRAQLVLGRPAMRPEAEAKMLREYAIDRIVCRNSGGEGAYAKIVAARTLNLPVVMIDRP